MFFPRLIRWLAGFPAPYALGILWWAEVTIDLCSIAGGYFLSKFLFEHIMPRFDGLLFPLAIITYGVVYYFIYLTFGQSSQLLEGLIRIHRIGGRLKAEELHRKAKKDVKETDKSKDLEPIIDPFIAPGKIRASAGTFKIRYFVVFPTAIVLYLLIFASTIYRIFTRQIQTLEPGYLLLPSLGVAIFIAICFWFISPYLPGIVPMHMLLGIKPKDGDGLD
jgi:hypothetical protein